MDWYCRLLRVLYCIIELKLKLVINMLHGQRHTLLYKFMQIGGIVSYLNSLLYFVLLLSNHELRVNVNIIQTTIFVLMMHVYSSRH